MSRRVFHMLLALGLALSVFVGTLAIGSAQNGILDGPNSVYFPWVPDGAEIEDDRDSFGTTGPYYGTVTIQNLEDEQIEITHETLATGEDDTDTIDAHGSLTLTTEHLFDDEDDVDGSGVLVTATYTGETEGSPRIAGVQKQASPDAPDDNAGTDGDHETVGGYTGLTEDEIGSEVILPIVQSNSNWNTLIRVTNFDDDEEIDVTLTVNPAGGGSSLNFTISDVAAGDTATVDLLDLGLAAEWVGSATLTADDAEVDIGAVAERIKNETNMLIMNTSQLSPANDDERYAPLVFNNYNLWNTGIALANLDDEENEVTITYFDLDGNEAGDDDLTLPANGMNFVYTPAQEEGVEFIGSAVIEAEGPIVGAVDEVKYFGDDLDTGHAMSYMVEDLSASVGQSLALALVQKGTVDAQQIAHGDTTGIHLFNPSDAFVVVSITYLDQDGNIETAEFETLGGKEGYTSYTVDIGLPDNFQGSAIVQAVSGAGSVVGASNNVNYDVEFDGSASFNLVLTGDVDLETTNNGD